MTYWLIYFTLLLTGLLIAIGLISRYHRHRPMLTNVVLALCALFLTGMAAECFFAFYAQTDSMMATLATRNWLDRYWHLNSLGYRDVEWTAESLPGKRKIVVMGDSFAEGYGIKNPADRFSDILGRKLGSQYIVMNVAIAGLNTQGEIERIKGFPYKPDILIYQYYINDIEDAARAHGLRLSAPHVQQNPMLTWLIKNSYAFNFAYWRLMLLQPHGSEGDYLTLVTGAYNDPQIWWTHQQELETIYQGSLSEGARLIVVVFPALTNISGSREITNKVVEFYQARSVPTLDVGVMLDNIPPDQLVVNSLDAHPNEWVHQQVANELYELVLINE